MKVLPIVFAVTLTLAFSAAYSHAHEAGGQKTAAALADLCNSDLRDSRSRCLGFIQGYLAGASSVKQQSADGLLDRASAESAWIRRAMDTRIGTKLRAMGRDLATPFCLTGQDPAAQIKARVRSEQAIEDGEAAVWLRSLANEEFPCDQPI